MNYYSFVFTSFDFSLALSNCGILGLFIGTYETAFYIEGKSMVLNI